MSDFAIDLIFILIVLVGAAVLGILIGYVFGLIQKKKATQDLEETIKDLQCKLLERERERKDIEIQADDTRLKSENRISDLEIELSAFQKERNELSKMTEDLKKALAKVKEEATFTNKEPVNVKKAPNTVSEASNLKIIEGIGPKIEELLKEEGIDTWVKLSLTSPDEIRSILISKGGSTYRIHDPRTWPYQAKLAAEGLWKDLKKYQDTISGGK